ncbi:MAG: hypothetical protein H7A18_04470 [Sinobacteraceae bacterium]|nr:hypothetical protein [Nevskiaceae bacterium]
MKTKLAISAAVLAALALTACAKQEAAAPEAAVEAAADAADAAGAAAADAVDAAADARCRVTLPATPCRRPARRRRCRRRRRAAAAVVTRCRCCGAKIAECRTGSDERTVRRRGRAV